jgi:CRISPR system Cascade subunit CasC
MTHFIQLHALTAYPPANLNRDDLGRPKTAHMGGVDRLRISSQSLKRAWRESEFFKAALDGHIGTRTKIIGKEDIYPKLTDADIDEKKAAEWTRELLGNFGQLEDEKSKSEKEPLKHLEFKQLVHISPLEKANINKFVEQYSSSKEAPSKEEMTRVITKDHHAVDIAAFGRMLADNPRYNIDAAIQVAHAITTHSITIEDDFFTAVDDLNKGEVDRGSAHLGEVEFGSGLFYLYVCIDRDLLKQNLGGNEELTERTIAALVESMAKIAPKGKQNTFASRARASYMLVEKGDEQPRSLAAAFFKAVSGEDIIKTSIDELEAYREKINTVYDEQPLAKSYDVNKGDGTLSELINFAKAE